MHCNWNSFQENGVETKYFEGNQRRGNITKMREASAYYCKKNSFAIIRGKWMPKSGSFLMGRSENPTIVKVTQHDFCE